MKRDRQLLIGAGVGIAAVAWWAWARANAAPAPVTPSATDKGVVDFFANVGGKIQEQVSTAGVTAGGWFGDLLGRFRGAPVVPRELDPATGRANF